jgi:hypothetical protein
MEASRASMALAAAARGAAASGGRPLKTNTELVSVLDDPPTLAERNISLKESVMTRYQLFPPSPTRHIETGIRVGAPASTGSEGREAPIFLSPQVSSND